MLAANRAIGERAADDQDRGGNAEAARQAFGKARRLAAIAGKPREAGRSLVIRGWVWACDSVGSSNGAPI